MVSNTTKSQQVREIHLPLPLNHHHPENRHIDSDHQGQNRNHGRSGAAGARRLRVADELVQEGHVGRDQRQDEAPQLLVLGEGGVRGRALPHSPLMG